jgi:hypothetical protein
LSLLDFCSPFGPSPSSLQLEPTPSIPINLLPNLEPLASFQANLDGRNKPTVTVIGHHPSRRPPTLNSRALPLGTCGICSPARPIGLTRLIRRLRLEILAPPIASSTSRCG